MKWVKHDTDANQDAKLQNVLLDYGLEGYGLFWYCIELIAGKVDKDNITFELEHDARIIARNTGSTPQKVEEMMRRFVELGLFENSDGVVTCLKLAKRLDKSMTSNPDMRAIIQGLKGDSHDPVMIESEKVMQDKNRLDKNRKDNNTPAKPKYEECDMNFAKNAFAEILKQNPVNKEPNFNTWANDVRKMRTIDKRDLTEMANLWLWIRQDSFWSTNILSISKFREKYDQLLMKAKATTQPQAPTEKQAVRQQLRNINNTDW